MMDDQQTILILEHARLEQRTLVWRRLLLLIVGVI